jgi:oxygen-independent coproporphyrinogen-3 oxidase
MELNGLAQYEISNFARPGYRCRHNLKYWLRQPVLAFGVGSHSYDGQSRYANHSNVNAYLQAIESGSSPVEWCRTVAKSQALQETLFLGLRLSEGLDWATIRSEYDEKVVAGHERLLRRMSEDGLTAWTGSHVRLTPRGMLLSNEIFQNFV